MNVILGNRILGPLRFHEGMQVVDLYPVSPHHPKGDVEVLALEFGRYPDVLLEPTFHGYLLGRASGRGGCPNELGTGLLQSTNQRF